MDAQRGIARRTVIGLPPDGLAPAWEKDFTAYPPAGVIVFRRDFKDLEDLRRLTSHLRALARPRRLFIAIDEEGGWVSQLAGHLVVPPNALLLGRGAEPGDVTWAARVTGERLRALGVDWVYAPVADVYSEPANPVIGPRAYSTDQVLAARLVGEALRGFREAGVASCLKHFPGHGGTRVDSHLALPVSEASRAELELCELVPFRDNLSADSVMTAHVVYKALDPDRPATFSPAIARDLLREHLGFKGVCITDALEMKGAAEGLDAFQRASRAIEAGCDLLLFAFHDPELRRIRLELARALVDGKIARASFDASRPRLAGFDHVHPEPTSDELAKPLESLTPPDWEARLERMIERGLLVRGALPPLDLPWKVTVAGGKPEDSLAPELKHEGVPLADGGGPALEVVVHAARTPLPEDEIERLRARCREGPVALVGLQNDSFLDALEEAAFRLSASDNTPLTRRVVARTLARRLREAAGARA